MTFLSPEALAKSYTCPLCGAIARQTWILFDMEGSRPNGSTRGIEDCPIRIGKCSHCDEHTLWLNEDMLHPFTGIAPRPNTEMPKAVRDLYEEAAAIFARSPRAAAALLRLSIQLLCAELGESGKNINSDIASLVRKGLPEVVQQSLDIVRVTGNESVHPGQIDTDDPAVVGTLFELINIIVEYMIAMPKRVSGLYASLPSNATNAITNRDQA